MFSLKKKIYMSASDMVDIRRTISDQDVRYVKDNMKKFSPGQMVNVKYGGGGGQCNGFVLGATIFAVVLIGVVLVGGFKLINDRKKNK
jgi:hypothetical protein